MRPESINILKQRPEEGKSNVLEGRIESAIYMGNYLDCRVNMGEMELRIQSDYNVSFEKDEPVYLEISPRNCLCLKE